MIRLVFLFFFFISAIFTDVKSPNGVIKFDVESDNIPEMTLNSTGLGIGVIPSANLHVNGNAIIPKEAFIGGNSGSANLNIHGTIGHNFQTVSSNSTLGDYSIVLADSSSDNITLTLPYAGNVAGRLYHIKKISTSNSVWISGGGNLIDDTSPIELPPSNNRGSVKLVSNGIRWYKVDQQNISDTIASDNLVAWWKLDEPSDATAVIDSSSSSYYGSIDNIGSDNVGVTGLFNHAINFNRSEANQKIAVSGIDMANWPALSVSVWVYYRGDGGGSDEHAVISNWDTGNAQAGFLIRIDPSTSDKIEAYVQGSPDGTGNQSRGDYTDLLVPKNTWSHIVITYDSTEGLNTYLNNTGSSLNPRTASGLLNSSTSNDLYLGYAWGNDWYDGLIDDVRIYNRVLTKSEIQVIYEQGQ
jgi:hypothetical protein